MSPPKNGLVGGFNPIWKNISQIGSFPQNRGENNNIVETTTYPPTN